MFNGFYSEPINYIPDNMHEKPVPPKQVSLVSDNLDVIFDKYGNKKGYSWNYGETVKIHISLKVPVRVEIDSYKSRVHNEEPTIHTLGHIGQKFYNLVDVRSWILASYVPDNRSYIWIEEPRFTFWENGPELVYVDPDMTDKYILIEFLNFRGEQIFEDLYKESSEYDWEIGVERSLTIQRGIYEMNI